MNAKLLSSGLSMALLSFASCKQDTGIDRQLPETNPPAGGDNTSEIPDGKQDSATIIETVALDLRECVMNSANVKDNTVYVINTEEAFVQYFTCNSKPQINFSTQTLLVASGSTTNGIHKITTVLSLKDNTCSLQINITLNDTTAAESWCVAAVTDKIHTPVRLNVHPYYDGDVETVHCPMPQHPCGWMYAFVDDLYPHQIYYVINSQEELAQHFSCESGKLPHIDFTAFTMLAFVCDYGSTAIHRLRQESELTYSWNIQIARGNSPLNSGMEVVVLTPKLPQSALIKLNTNINDYNTN